MPKGGKMVSYAQTQRNQKRGKDQKQKVHKQKTVQNMPHINLTVSIITLNMNGLNIPIRRQRMTEQLKKNKTQPCYVQEIYYNYTDKNR